MRRLNLILLLSAVTVALAFVISCKETNAERLEKMCGEWVSTKVSEKAAFFFCYAARLLSIFIFKISWSSQLLLFEKSSYRNK